MNSKDRQQERYLRRKEVRRKKLEEANAQMTFDKVITFKNLKSAFYLCRQDTNWKASVQRYGANILRNAYVYEQQIKEGKNIQRGFIEFTVCERGKTRRIKSVHISERVVQKALCQNAIIPATQRVLIYDNGASQKGKGTDFAVSRFQKHMRQAYRKYGNKFYILLGDGHDYFNSINHDIVKRQIRERILDKELTAYIDNFIDAFDQGLGLGSEICQMCAVGYANGIDHMIKDQWRIKWYGHFMDDWYLMSGSREELIEKRMMLEEEYAKLGISMNRKKTIIVRADQGFTWLKDRYFMTDTGKLVRRPNRDSVKRFRKRLKAIRREMDEGKATLKDAEMLYGSFLGYISRNNGNKRKLKKNAYRTMRSMQNLYNKLFIEEWRVNNEQHTVSEQG